MCIHMYICIYILSVLPICKEAASALEDPLNVGSVLGPLLVHLQIPRARLFLWQVPERITPQRTERGDWGIW